MILIHLLFLVGQEVVLSPPALGGFSRISDTTNHDNEQDRNSHSDVSCLQLAWDPVTRVMLVLELLLWTRREREDER